MKLLFISRAYPPVTGGIENQNYELSVWLPKFAEVTTLANPYGKKFLPLFLPYVILRLLFTLHRYDVVLFGDGVLSIVGFIGKFFFPRKIFASVIHGLDLTWRNDFYQKWWVEHFIPTLDGIIAVSEETKKLALGKHISEAKITVIPNGINPETLQTNDTREDLEKFLGKDLKDISVLLTAGRLAKRKGVEWFIRNVLPSLPASVLYVVSGTGIEEENIKRAIIEMHTEEKIQMLGQVSDEERNLLLNTADIFVQPNIHVNGDMEGFGIAVIEASVCGRPVIASNIEGLKDALATGENGILVASENSVGFREAIQTFLSDDALRIAFGKKARIYTENHYHWNKIAPLYIHTLESLRKK